jgi:hypothetical protein
MRVLLILILVAVFSSCVRNKNGQQVIQSAVPTNNKVFEVNEVIQTDRYTYLKVIENSNERWVAVSKQAIEVGDVFYYDKALQMNNFNSKDLDRTFEVIYFVNQISKNPTAQAQSQTGSMPAHSGKIDSKKATVELTKTEGEITIAQIFKNRDEFASKEFEIRGVVVKINKQVMGKNWIHIQDGTNHEGSFDLTITSQDIAEIGDEVIFKGKLTLNKNFGSGYFYDVILEDAELVKKQLSNL